MTNAEAKRRMLSLLESCETFEQALQAMTAAVETMFADDTNPPASLGSALGALSAATDAFAALDSDCA